MCLTQTSEYALRAMVFLASVEGESIRSKDLSHMSGIPIHYLSKIMRRLVVAGLVRSQKGHRGGFRLARLAKDIRFLDILMATGYEPEPDRCAFGWGNCDTVNPCPLHNRWNHLNSLIIEWATETRLSAVAQSPEELDKILTLRNLN